MRLAAASFRICLEALHNDLGYKTGDLCAKIDTLLDDPERHVPKDIANHLHDLRDGGNIASHKALDIIGGLIEVEKEEVDACKSILEMCLDEFYERPMQRKQMSDSIQEKKERWTKSKTRKQKRKEK